jgi:transposase
MAPLVRRTWAPIGQTPIFYQRTGAREKVSIIGAITVSPRRRRVGLYFSLLAGQNVTAENLMPFLRQLRAHLGGRFILIWDRLNVHRAIRMQKFLGGLKRVRVEFLPPYAPELNPVEGLWGYLKMNPLANHAPRDADELAARADGIIQDVQDDTHLLRSFIKRTPLSLCLK